MIVNILRRAGWASLGLLLALVAACGGGGGGGDGGGGGTPPPSVAPTITAQPQDLSVPATQAARFAVAAAGTSPLSYQWRQGGIDIPGATAFDYTIAAASLADSGTRYSVLVSNAAGTVTSNAALLTVTAAPSVPVITSSPTNASVSAGQSASFSVLASGAPTLRYQWTKNGAPIAGATAASYTTPATVLADSGTRFAVVVSNDLASTASAEASLTVTGTVPSTGRYVEAWSSADASSTGSYRFGIVDPQAPGLPVEIDTLPFVATSSLSMIHRVRGGSYDATTGTVSAVGTRYVVYLKDGRAYKVKLDKTGSTPVPELLTADTGIVKDSLQLLTQSLSGDDALFSYTINTFQSRYVRLSAPAGSVGTPGATYPGDAISGTLVQALHDPTSGSITGYLWAGYGALGDPGLRLFRTDANFAKPVSIARYTTGDFTVKIGMGGLTPGMHRKGLFLIGDGVLRRYDFATGTLRDLYPGVTKKLFGANFDDDSMYLPVQTTDGPKLIAARDDNSSAARVLPPGAPLDTAGLIIRQTKDYIVFLTNSAGTAVSVRKSDGVQTVLPNASGLIFSWLPLGPVTLVDGYSVGNRVFYFRTDSTVGNMTGSVAADGSDRKEHSGLLTLIGALPDTVQAHRLFTSELGGLPVERVLLAAGTTKKWLSIATGDIGATIGTLGAKTPDIGCSETPYQNCLIGQNGTAGNKAYVEVTPGTKVWRVDSWFLSDQTNSLLRLTTNIP
jgi:Immunoglobulin I-set domain